MGLRRALIPSVVSETVIWSIVPHVSYQWLLPLVFVGGLLTLPIFSVVRQSLGVLADGDQRRTAFALDAISTELVFMIGPAAGAIVATSGHSVLGPDGRRRRHLPGRAVPDVVQPAHPQCGTPRRRRLEADEQEAAEVAVVAAAPAHVQEAAAELGPLGRRRAAAPAGSGPAAQGRAQLRLVHAPPLPRCLRSPPGPAWCSAAPTSGIVAALETGGHQARNRDRVPLLVRGLGGRRPGLRRHAPPRLADPPAAGHGRPDHPDGVRAPTPGP